MNVVCSCGGEPRCTTYANRAGYTVGVRWSCWSCGAIVIRGRVPEHARQPDLLEALYRRGR